MTTLRGLILEGIETMLTDHCNAFGMDDGTAFVIFVTATARREGLLRKAGEQEVAHIDNIHELVPQIVDGIDRRLLEAGIDEAEIEKITELAVVVLFTGAMETIGDMEIMKDMGE